MLVKALHQRVLPLVVASNLDWSLLRCHREDAEDWKAAARSQL